MSWTGSNHGASPAPPRSTTASEKAEQILIAAERGVELSDLHWRPEDHTALSTSRHLGHLVGCNGFFTGLLRAARASSALVLDNWWSARRCAKAWGVVVRPDGFAVWDHHGRRVPFFLEYDNGTETLGRLEAELSGYAKLASAVGHPTWVLFRFPSMGREAHARRVLSHPDVPVATAVLVRLHITSPDIEDETTPPLPFGLGPHHCLVAAWVRMVCRTSCRALVRRYRIHLISATAAEPRHLIPGLSELLVVLQP